MSHDLHGSAPDQCRVALLLIDVINDLEFSDGDALFAFALPLADDLAALERRARAAHVPCIYVNDNFGRWRSDFHKLVGHCLRDGARGRPIVERLLPDDEDYFVLKPKHSGFYASALDLLLHHLGVRTVVLTGIAGNLCVLHTAHDAYMRELEVIVAADCVASNTREDNDYALAHMARALKADVLPSTEIDFDAIKAGARESRTRA